MTAYVNLATTTLTGSQSSITFSSVSQSYRHLIIIINALADTGGRTCGIRFNGDTNTNYGRTGMYSDGSGLTANRTTSQTSLEFLNSAVSGTNPTFTQLNIMNYRESSWKSILFTTTSTLSTSGQVEQYVGTWASTSAINEVTLINSGSYIAGTTVTLYGLS